MLDASALATTLSRQIPRSALIDPLIVYHRLSDSDVIKFKIYPLNNIIFRGPARVQKPVWASKKSQAALPPLLRYRAAGQLYAFQFSFISQTLHRFIMVKLSYACLLLFCAITRSSVASPLTYVPIFYTSDGPLNNVYNRTASDSRGLAAVDRVHSGSVASFHHSNELGNNLNDRSEYDRRDLLEA
jgi:hypothetical protein